MARTKPKTSRGRGRPRNASPHTPSPRPASRSQNNSDDDIVPGPITPVTTPEDSDVSSQATPAVASNHTRIHHSPFLESIRESSSSSVPASLRASPLATPQVLPSPLGSRSPQNSGCSGRSNGRTPRPQTGKRGRPSSSGPNRGGTFASKTEHGARSTSTSGRTWKSNQKRNTRYRPGQLARLEIRKYQQTWNLLIPKLPFQRLVREITIYVTNCDSIRYQGIALEALQEAAEAFLIGTMEDSYLISLAARRVTLMDRDIQLAIRIRGRYQY